MVSVVFSCGFTVARRCIDAETVVVSVVCVYV